MVFCSPARRAHLYACLVGISVGLFAAAPARSSPRNPTVMTQRLLRELLASDQTLRAYVDAGRGVLQINYRDDESEGSEQDYPGPERGAWRLCGDRLDRRVARFRKTLNHMWKELGNAVSCSNVPVAQCSIRGDHDTPDVELRFVIDEQRGLILDSIWTAQFAGLGEAHARLADAYVDQQRRKLGAGRCHP